MTLKVFVSGQSNALGRYSGGRDWAGISSDVSVWNNINPLGTNGSAFVSASAARVAGTFEHTDRNNFGVWFCDLAARTQFDTVTMTIVARGGSSISEWSPSETTYPMLQECIDVWAATGQAPADVFLWHQGENDAVAADYAGWISAFNDLVGNLKAGGVISDSTIILLGGITCTSAVKVDFNKLAISPAAAMPMRRYVSSYLLDSDGIHFYGDALNRLSERYFHCFMSAMRSVLAGGV